MKLQGSNILGQEQIDLLTTRGLNFVWFPKQLETIYRFQYQNGAAYEFRYRAPIILILYLFLSFGIYQVLPTEQVLSWLSYYSWVGIIVLIAWILSFIKKLNQWFDYYVGIGSSAAVAITFILINVLENGQDNVLFHAAMMYAIVIIYGAVGMRFYTAIIAGWVGGLIGILVSTYLNGDIDWTFLNRTYSMTLAYATDRQHRENYLQNCMIELNRIELMQQAQQLSLLSQQDALTGLANRRYLDETLDNEWRRALRHETPLTIMMVDIDFFKPYNDSLGHLKGDQCLKDIATAISSIAARSGDLVARYGGEEFLLLFPMTNAQQAKIQAERLMNAIKKIAIVHPCSSVSPYVTISVGVATTIPRLNDSISAFVSRADHALYQAKTNGRNQYQIALNEEQIVDLT
ncbi:GGDEF domain-containing protein [Acinetobacter baumannii]